MAQAPDLRSPAEDAHVFVVLGGIGTALGPYVSGVFATREGATSHVADLRRGDLLGDTFEIDEQVVRP